MTKMCSFIQITTKTKKILYHVKNHDKNLKKTNVFFFLKDLRVEEQDDCTEQSDP